MIGTRSSHDALAFVSRLPEDVLLAALDELRRARVIEEREEDGEILYDFTHPLLQEALYAELGLARARALHATIAESLEEFHGEAAASHAGELAFHYLRADAKRLADKAVQYLKLAGCDAMALLPKAVEAGVAYVPGAAFFANDPDVRTLRLSFVTLAPADIADAVQKLGNVIKAHLAAQPSA